jgi:hypothetical protein
MARFDASNFMSTTPDGTDLDIYTAKFKDIRFSVPASASVEIDASTESNLPYLAEKYLGDQNLWWIILEYNGLIDPIDDVSPGVTLLIPERRSVIAYLDANLNNTLSTTLEI